MSTSIHRRAAAIGLVGLLWLLASVRVEPTQTSTPVVGYRVVHAYPHDPNAYTQGLILRFLDPGTFREIRRIVVTDGGTGVKNLNELEYVRGEIYANVWHTDRIARISPQSGRVIGWIDLKGLLSPVYRLDPEAVLNGIAHDAARDRLFVTGKLWPQLFEIEVVPRAVSIPR